MATAAAIDMVELKRPSIAEPTFAANGSAENSK